MRIVDFSDGFTSASAPTSSPLGAPDGTVGAPGITFASDLDSGWYRIGANNIGLALNGAKVVDYATTGVTVTGIIASTGTIRSADGTVSLPGFTFTSDLDCGFYRIGANNLALALNGAKVVDYSTAGVAVTGIFSATGASTFTNTVNVTPGSGNNSIVITGPSSASNNSGEIVFKQAAQYSFLFGSGYIATGAMEIIPSTASGGTTFSNPVFQAYRTGAITVGNATLAGAVTFPVATDATSSTAAAVAITGGLAVAKKAMIGTNLLVGTSAPVIGGNEQASVNITNTDDTISKVGIGSLITNSYDGAAAFSYRPFYAQIIRALTSTSRTDTGTLSVVNATFRATASGGTPTLTNSSNMISVFTVVAPSVGGAGTLTLALTDYAGVNVQASSLATGTNKYGVYIGAQTGATTNFALNSEGGLVRFKSGSVICSGAALATNATTGFLYIPTCAGTPTGAPDAQTGTVAMIYDTSNNKLYIYNAAWKGGTAPGAWS